MAKTTKTYTVEELKTKCQAALADPNFADIARTTPSSAYKRAFEYVHSRTNDLQAAKRLAVATRWLAMLRRDHREEFEKFVAQGKQLKLGKKPFAEMEFLLPFYATVIKRTAINVHDGTTVVIQIPSGPRDAMYFCLEILNAILEDDSLGNPREELRSKLIQLLEEKFGLRVRICGNCKRYQETNCLNGKGACYYHVPDSYPPDRVSYFGSCAVGWAPK